MEKSNASRNGVGHFLRILRPLVWWLLLVLVLYGIRTHERLLEQTRLNFSVMLQGQPIYAVVMLDGNAAISGQRISLGSHSISVTYPKTEPFSTNLFIWYGPHDLGQIKLKRTVGTLHIQATPSAPTITIIGAEFSTTLYDCTDTNLTVPTDQYSVRADYPHWSRMLNPVVDANGMVPCTFSPQLGGLRLSCNKVGATYRLVSGDGQISDSGDLPITLWALPAGGYQVTVSYHDRQLQESESVVTGTTNDVPFQFTLGAVRLETVPAGADVRTADGSYLGQTPLVVPDLTPQSAQFNLSLAGYVPVSVTMEITADQTNSCSTNLMSGNYLAAMGNAKMYMAAANYSAVVQATTAALSAKPGDQEALALQTQAKAHVTADQERQEQLNRPRKLFDSIRNQGPDEMLFRGHELTTSKPAEAVKVAIVNALQAAPQGYQILSQTSPEPQTYEISAQQTFSLGILGGTERDCRVVVGQAKEGETQIFYELLQYQIQHTLVNFHDVKRLVPISPGRIQMNDILQTTLNQGEQNMAERVQQGIDQAADPVK